MKARHQARLRNFATALAVMLLHVVAIRALLIMRGLLVPSAGEEPAPPLTTWVYLPPETPAATAGASTTARAFIMTPLVDENVAPGVVALPVSLLPPSLPALALPTLAPLADPNAHAFAAIGDYFACDFANFDKLDDEQRTRCALRFSHLGDIAPLAPGYVDGKSTPFSLFGAHGTFTITPPTEKPFDLMASSIGCSWDVKLCRRQPDKFGFDPDDQKRLTAAAHFDLGKGWSLDAGAQGYMSRYLGGARFVLTGGATVAYRW